jgi:very-short-patch-repair endonuclease
VAVVSGTPPTWRQAVRAVLLACGDHVAASHSTALVLLVREQRPSDEHIHVIAGLAHRIELDGVIAHRSGVIEEGDVIRRDGMNCTSPLRTVIDLSGAMTAGELGKVVDEFLRRRLLTLEALRERVGRTRPAPGRSVATLRKVLAQRLPGYDAGESALEARIARIIDAHHLPRPAHQHRVQYGECRYRIDFAWPDRKLYLEGNGFGWHSLSTDLDGDARRQNELVLDGWAPIEITWRMTDAEIATTIRRFIEISPKRL